MLTAQAGRVSDLHARTTMSKVLVTFIWDDEPTLSDVIERFSLKESDIDRDFGVVEIDPDRRMFTALVDSVAADRIRNIDSRAAIHSNPAIRPF